MRREMYDLMRSAEDRHWWYYGMRRISESLLLKHVGRHPAQRVLDAGCGTGGSTRWLTDWGQVTGLDLSELALSYSRQRGLPRLVRSSVNQLPFPSEMFDLVVSFDVLYHEWVDDDAALHEFARVLRPSGTALVRVAAHQRLKSPHDVAALTRHRYSGRELVDKMQQAGFQVAGSTYVNSVLFPVALARRWLQTRSDDSGSDHFASDYWIPPAPMNFLLGRLLALEAPLASRARLPLGLSVVAVGRKP